MKKPLERICLTCKHYEPYHCTLDEHYIGYVDAELPMNCMGWRMDDKYKKGGIWYDSRPEKERNMGEKKDGMNPVGAWVKTIMDEKKISIREIGRIANVSPSTISRWVRGASQPKYEELVKVAEAFDCHIEIVPN